jgi:hypothetical protein
MNEDITIDLEAMIDKHGLVHVLTGLACVCREKADHLRTNWQDKTSARQWDRDAKACDIAATKIST